MSAVGPTGGMSGGIGEIMALRSEVLSRSQALRDVREASGSAPSVTATPTAPSAPQQAGGFAEALTGALENVSAVQNRSSEMQAAYERGEVTDIAKVMIARQEAGVAFEATLQVRNKLLSAYQDIMRMGS
ncbi:flagellar hook-basal body complex protein FliE [Qipengyuania nanhaisediminis]|uniref:flagellar hook-basal body complex protein FliE n=1 Tax=Qipengyuania nanhaisediminis TaxID=604088 RepID=UPI0038B3DAC0